MEVNYKRRLNQSYMILKKEDSNKEAYELAVLAYNKIPGFLPVEIEIADGSMQFWYDITGRQTLKDYLIRKQAGYELLELLFESIGQILEVTFNYLLEEENILLQEEYIYMDFAGKHLEFVYFPGWKKDNRTAFRELMEVLLQRLDHSDKKAAAIAYEMYQKSLGEEEAFSVMLKKVFLEATEEHSRELYGDKNMELLQEERWEKEENLLPELNKAAELHKESKLTKKNQFFEKTKLTKKNKQIENSRRNAGWFKQKIKSRDKQEEPVIMQYQDDISYPTEVLAGNKGIQGILIYQGMGTLPSIRIDRDSFIIGKQEGEVNGFVDSKTVSRIHARIEKAEDEYYIEDLNSTNGTYLNGEVLEYHQKVKLQMKDRVAFGIEEYLFL